MGECGCLPAGNIWRLTLRDMSHGLVAAPRSHAVIIMDLRGMVAIYTSNIYTSFLFGPHLSALPAHVSVSLYIPVVLPVADELEEAVSVPDREETQV